MRSVLLALRGAMVRNPAEPAEEQESSIEEFLASGRRSSRQIREKFQREITVMFTDIAPSTEFYETYGDITVSSDISGVQDLRKPIIEKHGGKVLRALGDGLMAIFESPPMPYAAVAIQSTLAAGNQDKNPPEQVWVKVAVHHGLGIVEKGCLWRHDQHPGPHLRSDQKGRDPCLPVLWIS